MLELLGERNERIEQLELDVQVSVCAVCVEDVRAAALPPRLHPAHRPRLISLHAFHPRAHRR